MGGVCGVCGERVDGWCVWWRGLMGGVCDGKG